MYLPAVVALRYTGYEGRCKMPLRKGIEVSGEQVPVVRINGLGYRYRGQKGAALQGVDLKIGEGEFVVFMGPSGAGKSTLCISLNGLIPHFFRGRMQGEVRVRGRSTREGRVGEFAREVGLVFQDFEVQLFSTNVSLEVAFGPDRYEHPTISPTA
jgi:energy-coupling factor transport system ATP-binding protein